MSKLLKDSIVKNFKSVLRNKFPFLYNLLRSIKWTFRYLEARVLGSRVEELRWAHRSLQKVRLAKEQRGENHPHRDLLLQRLESMFPFSSVCEIGWVGAEPLSYCPSLSWN